MSSSGDRKSIGSPGKISGVDLVAGEIFDIAKSEPCQIAHQRGRIEEQLKGFTGAGYSLRERVERELLGGAEKRSLDGEVECDAAGGWHAGDELDGGVEGGPRKVGRDAQPGEEGRLLFPKPRLLQPDIER